MDDAEFTRQVGEHLPAIRKVVRSYAFTEADRSDLTQEVLGQLWRTRGRIDPGRKVSTWVYRVALNVAISWSRRERRRAGRQRPYAEEAVARPGEDPGRVEELKVLQACIAELGEFDRALVVLSLEDRDHAAIAEVLGISRSNVGTRLARVRERLRADFERRAGDSRSED